MANLVSRKEYMLHKAIDAVAEKLLNAKATNFFVHLRNSKLFWLKKLVARKLSETS